MKNSRTIIKTCGVCKKEFKTFMSLNKISCSHKCACLLVKQNTYEKYKKICLVCGKEFLPPRPKEGGTFCSYRCRGIDRRADKVNRNGYWYINVGNHPFRNKAKYVPEHHLVMESYLQRYVQPGEVVHHRDGDTANNNINNLKLMTDSEHKSFHAKLYWKRNNLSIFIKKEARFGQDIK